MTVDGKTAPDSAPPFFLDGRSCGRSRPRLNCRACRHTAKLKDETAALLNHAFGTDALTDALVIGVAKISVNAA